MEVRALESALRLAKALETRSLQKSDLGAAPKSKTMKRPAAHSQGTLRRPAAAGSVEQCNRKAARPKTPKPKPAAKKKPTKVTNKKAKKMTRECVYSRTYHQAQGALAEALF